MIDASVKTAIVRFSDGGYVTMYNLGWGVFKITGASEDKFRYLDWQYLLETPNRERAQLPNIDLLDTRGRLWYISRPTVVGIEKP